MKREIGECWHPLTLLFLTSYLIKHGKSADILDLTACADPKNLLREYLAENLYPIVGFTGDTENRFLVWDLIAMTREILSESLIVVGGNHFTFTAQETFETIREVDVIVKLDGEETLLELVEKYEKGESFENIAGIVYRNGEEILHNPPRPVTKDLDRYKIKDEAYQHIIQLNQQETYTRFMTLPNYVGESVKALSIHVGRGCPGQCTYCIYNKKQYRGRSVESVFEEIKDGIENYGCRNFYLDDPYLAKRKRFITDLCNTISREKLNIQWYAELRADMDHDLLVPMRDAGCTTIDFGLETASPRVIKAIRKHISLPKVSEFIHRCYRLGIRVQAFTMLSLPDEYEEDAMMTLDFVKQHWHMLHASYLAETVIYPGTQMETMAKERGILPKDFKWYDRHVGNVPMWVEHLSPEFIQYFRKEWLKMSYSKRPFLKEAAGRAIPFLTDWSSDGIKLKRAWLGTTKKYLIDWPLLSLRRR